MAEPKTPDDFEIKAGDSAAVKSLKHHAKSITDHIAKREAHAKTLSGEEALNHQQTLAEEKARLSDIRKALK